MVPAVAKSTACETDKTACATETQSEVVARVNDYGDKAEAAARSAAGVAVRGGWILALNNEALALGLETAASVFVRKSVERAAWSILTKQCPGISGEPTIAPVRIRLT